MKAIPAISHQTGLRNFERRVSRQCFQQECCGAPLRNRASYPSSPPQLWELSYLSRLFLGLHRQAIYPTSRQLLIARSKKSLTRGLCYIYTNKRPPPKVVSTPEASVQHADSQSLCLCLAVCGAKLQQLLCHAMNPPQPRGGLRLNRGLK